MNMKCKLKTLRQSSPQLLIPFRNRRHTQHMNQKEQVLESPLKGLDRKKLQNCLSFKEIRNVGSGRQTFYVKGKNPSMTKLPYDYEQENQNYMSNVARTKTIQSPIRNKEDSTYALKQAHQLENNSLKQTIQILKEQIQFLNHRVHQSQKENKKFELLNRVKVEEAKEKDRKYKQYKKKSKDYDDLEPKLNELEEMQIQLIEENKKFKQRETIAKSIFQNISTLLMMEMEKAKRERRECDHTLLKICTLVEAYDF